MTDNVHHPKHYTSHPSGVECIEVTRALNFNLGNAFKYLFRRDHKNDSLENLEKALWYLNDEIANWRFTSRSNQRLVAYLVDRIIKHEPAPFDEIMKLVLTDDHVVVMRARDLLKLHIDTIKSQQHELDLHGDK